MAKWMSGGNSSETLTPSEEGSRRSRVSFREGKHHGSSKLHSAPTTGGDRFGAETCGKFVEIPYCKGWQDLLQDAMAELGATDSRCVLVTDVLGIEVTPADRASSQTSSERFPLRVRAVSSNHLPHPSSPPRKTSKSSVRTPDLEKESAGRLGQISLTVDYEDIWPGILKVKLGEQGVILNDDSDGLNFLVATDATGVELDLSRARVPSPDRFPLKLHFRAHRMGPQNLPVSQCPNNSLNGSSGGPTLERSASKRGAAMGQADRRNDYDLAGAMFEHSMELPFSGMLSDIVNAKLVSIGICLGDSGCRQLALITDCLGVVVDADGGLPDRHRFPIKVHIERSSLMTLAEDDKRRIFGDNRKARRSFADMGGADANNSMANMVGARWSSACESMLKAFVRSRAGCKDPFVLAA